MAKPLIDRLWILQGRSVASIYMDCGQVVEGLHSILSKAALLQTFVCRVINLPVSELSFPESFAFSSALATSLPPSLPPSQPLGQ